MLNNTLILYFDKYQGVNAYMESIKGEAKAKGYVENRDGQKGSCARNKLGEWP
jgi:DNA polymerase I - 3''-5'' exonuclease and polymerase domains